MATLWKTMYSMNILDKEMIHVLGGMEKRDTKFHHTTQYGMQLKFYELFLKFFI